jgi:hypothetical protein
MFSAVSLPGEALVKTGLCGTIGGGFEARLHRIEHYLPVIKATCWKSLPTTLKK